MAARSATGFSPACEGRAREPRLEKTHVRPKLCQARARRDNQLLPRRTRLHRGPSLVIGGITQTVAECEGQSHGRQIAGRPWCSLPDVAFRHELLARHRALLRLFVFPRNRRPALLARERGEACAADELGVVGLFRAARPQAVSSCTPTHTRARAHAHAHAHARAHARTPTCFVPRADRRGLSRLTLPPTASTSTLSIAALPPAVLPSSRIIFCNLLTRSVLNPHQPQRAARATVPVHSSVISTCMCICICVYVYVSIY